MTDISKDAVEPEALKIVALVSSNGTENLVLNRPLKFIYEKQGRDLIGHDGPFRDVLRYEEPIGSQRAFAGRKFDIPLKDGSKIKAEGQYWSAGLKGYESVAYQSVDGLKNCYVFVGGACVDPVALAEMKASYEGPTYQYWDYEKLIKYDDLRMSKFRELRHLEDGKRSVVKEVKAKHRQVLALSARNTELEAENAKLRGRVKPEPLIFQKMNIMEPDWWRAEVDGQAFEMHSNWNEDRWLLFHITQDSDRDEYGNPKGEALIAEHGQLVPLHRIANEHRILSALTPDTDAISAAVKAERERCAKVAEKTLTPQNPKEDWTDYAKHNFAAGVRVAGAIRGETE